MGTALWWPSPPPGRLPRAGQLPCELLALCVLAAPERLLHVDVRTSRMSVPVQPAESSECSGRLSRDSAPGGCCRDQRRLSEPLLPEQLFTASRLGGRGCWVPRQRDFRVTAGFLLPQAVCRLTCGVRGSPTPRGQARVFWGHSCHPALLTWMGCGPTSALWVL